MLKLMDKIKIYTFTLKILLDLDLWYRLAPVLKTIFLQCVISYSCSQSNSDGSVLKQSCFQTEPAEFVWLQVYDMTH